MRILCIRVSDDGLGMDEAEAQTLQQRLLTFDNSARSIGLRNLAAAVYEIRRPQRITDPQYAGRSASPWTCASSRPRSRNRQAEDRMYKVIIVEDEGADPQGAGMRDPWTELDCTVVGGGRELVRRASAPSRNWRRTS